jgi:hypothetical protein
LGLLQGWLDIGAMVILSLLCFIWAGQAMNSTPASKPSSLAATFGQHSIFLQADF